MDRRAVPALVAGLGGAALGLLATAGFGPVPAALAAVCSIAAAVTALRALDTLRQAEARERRPGRAETVMDGTSWVGIDRETGLPDARFFELALDNRVSAARRQLWPVTVLLLELGAGRGQPLAAGEATAFTMILKRTLRDADTICRVGARTFAVVLEDATEERGVQTAERLLAGMVGDHREHPPVAAAVASYPAHGLRATEIVQRAQDALERACDLQRTGPGAVQVAAGDSTT